MHIYIELIPLLSLLHINSLFLFDHTHWYAYYFINLEKQKQNKSSTFPLLPLLIFASLYSKTPSKVSGSDFFFSLTVFPLPLDVTKTVFLKNLHSRESSLVQHWKSSGQGDKWKEQGRRQYKWCVSFRKCWNCFCQYCQKLLKNI